MSATVFLDFCRGDLKPSGVCCTSEAKFQDRRLTHAEVETLIHHVGT